MMELNSEIFENYGPVCSGNYFQGEEFSIPRFGMAAFKVDGVPFTKLTAYGVDCVERHNYLPMPLVISEGWLSAFQFELKEESSEKSVWVIVKEHFYNDDVYSGCHSLEVTFNKIDNIVSSMQSAIHSVNKNKPEVSGQFPLSIKHVHHFQNTLQPLLNKQLIAKW